MNRVMKASRLSYPLARASLVVVGMALFFFQFSQPASSAAELGPPPTPPLFLPPAIESKFVPATLGWNIDLSSRAQSRAFFNAVYHGADAVPIGTTAKVANFVAGTNSFAF